MENKNLKYGELVDKVTGELKEHFNIEVIRLFKQYEIPQVLPDLKNIKYSLTATEARYTDKIFLAGDILVNGSLNAAMPSGESAALAIIKALQQIEK